MNAPASTASARIVTVGRPAFASPTSSARRAIAGGGIASRPLGVKTDSLIDRLFVEKHRSPPDDFRRGPGRSCDTQTEEAQMSTVASKLNITKVGRVCVTVADTDRAIDFYSGTLGFEKVVDEPMGPDMRWVEVAVLRRGDDDRARPAAAGPAGRRRPDRDHPRHDRRRRRPRGTEGGRRGRRRRGHPLRRAGAADVLAPRPGRQLAHRRPALDLITAFDLRTVDFLARLRLRTGARLVRAPRELWELLDLCGLGEVVGKTEERKQARRVEEERELDDPPV